MNIINWNTVPAFYNDSYTYMEWLGKLTSKIEDHETRLTLAEAEIDTLQEDMASVKNTLENHEGRITANEKAIAELQPVVTELYNWYGDTAKDAVEYVTTVRQQITTALTTTIPALQEQTAENTAAIISMQREGTTVYIDATEDTTVSGVNISTTYAPLSPVEKSVDTVYRISATIGSNSESFVIRDMLHIGSSYTGITHNADGYISYTIAIATTGTVTITLGAGVINSTAFTDTDISNVAVAQCDLVLYAGKSITPTSEKEEFQASVKIFTDKTIPLDNRTASFILQYYSAASIDPGLTWAEWAADYNVQHPTGLQLDLTADPDTNKDGKINAIDASNVMTYYSNVSAGRTQYVISDTDKFYQWYLDGNPPEWEY